MNFNPQGPHGPRRGTTAGSTDGTTISIHKALTGLDVVPSRHTPPPLYFNTQGPHGPRLVVTLFNTNAIIISIHKALTGLDQSHPVSPQLTGYFNPQGPHGPRHLSGPVHYFKKEFQSTRPSRASTLRAVVWGGIINISIHKALTGLDNLEL